MKRYLTIALLVLLLGGALGYFFHTYWKKTQSRPLEHALLQNTSFYLRTPDALGIFPSLRNMPYGDEVYSLPVFAKLENQLNAFDSLLRATGYTLGGTPLLASLYATGANQYDWLFIVDGSKTEAEELLGKLSGIEGAIVNKRLYREETVLDITMPGERRPFSCASLNGILMGSFSAFLVEEGIIQLEEKEPLEETDHRFRKVRNFAGKAASLSVFFNPGIARALGKQFIDEAKSPMLAHMGMASSWMTLDVSFGSNNILLGGYALPDSLGILSTFTHSARYEFGFDKVLPINTAFFAAQEITLDLEGPNGKVASYLKDDWMTPYACYGLLEPLDEDYSSEWYLTLPVIDEEIAKQSLMELASISASGDLFVDVVDGTSIGRLENDSALVHTLGLSAWLPLYNPYFAVKNGHVFFTNDPNTLKEILAKLSNGQVLSANPAYVAFAQEVSSANNLYVYLNPTRMGELLPSLLLSDVLEGKGSTYKKFSPVGLQFNYDDGVMFTIALIHYSGSAPTTDDGPREDAPAPTGDMLAWRLSLDDKLVGKPHLVTNHNTGELEVFVQDAQNNIYLVNKAGKIFWKVKIDGPIMGSVYQMDLYQNNKLQYIFNTKQKIHLIDRNGNNVEQFPFSLAAKAVNGLFLIDDGKKNYQYFVACENYKVYGYTSNGKPLQGWNPKPRVGTIPFAVQRTESGGKDYLILTNIDGTLLYYNINGDRHERPIRLEAEFEQPFYIHEHNKSFTLMNASKDHLLFTVNAKGEVKETTAESLPPYYYFTGAKVDTALQYVFVAPDKVSFTSPELIVTNTFTPKQPLDLPGQLFNLGESGQLLGLTSAAGNEVYLIDMLGQLLPGMPLKGSTHMEVGHLFGKDELTLIVGDDDGNINAYRLP